MMIIFHNFIKHSLGQFHTLSRGHTHAHETTHTEIIDTHARTHTWTHTHTDTRTHEDTHGHIRAYTHTHTWTRTDTHIRTQTLAGVGRDCMVNVEAAYKNVISRCIELHSRIQAEDIVRFVTIRDTRGYVCLPFFILVIFRANGNEST